MDWVYVILVFILGVMFLAAIGMPVALAFVTVNIVAAFFIFGGMHGLEQIIFNATQSISTYALLPVAMFILMGEIFFRTGLATRVFDAVELLLGRVPGRLSFVAVGGGTIFASLSGSSMANTAMMGSTLAPSMFERKYHPNMVFGPIMGAGCLAALIPPSGLAVLLATLADIDVGRLLVGGIIPGLIIAGSYLIIIAVQVFIDPSKAPAYDVKVDSWTKNLFVAIFELLPMAAIVFTVVGMIIFGLATPTESSAFGVLAVLIVAACFGKISFRIFSESLISASKNTSMLLIILLSSSTFSQLLAFSGASSSAVQFALSFDLSVYEMIFMMLFVLLLLGMVMDQTSMMMITFPMFLPIIGLLGLDPIWFGILVLITLEMALLSPPFGLLLFVMLGVSPKETTYWEVIKAAFPYFVVQFVALLAIVFWPSIVTWLPDMM